MLFRRNPRGGDYDIAHLYDLYQSGLAWSGRIDESMEICKYVINTYTLNNLPAANCAMGYARYLSGYERRYDEALDLLNGIAKLTPFDAIMPWVNLSQAEILYKQGKVFQAFGYVQDAIIRSKFGYPGAAQACLQDALKLQQSILNN